MGAAVSPAAGERTPLLALDGYSGSLEGLLILARMRRIDISEIPLLDLADQLAVSLRDAPPETPVSQKGSWIVMAAWLLQLRSLLLLPAGAPAHQAAQDEAEYFRNRLAGLAEIQALAAWLDRRPHLGRDVFTRGEQPEGYGDAVEAASEIDVIEFLWASMALFDDSVPGPDVSETYRPGWRDFYSIAEARARILKRIAAASAGLPLGQLLPEEAAPDEIPAGPALRKRAAWTSTFIASLELAKQGEVTLTQEEIFSAIHVSPG